MEYTNLSAVNENGLSFKPDFNLVLLLQLVRRDQVALDLDAVQGQLFDAFAEVIRVMNRDVDLFVSENALDGKAIPFGGDAGINAQPVDLRLDAQNILGGAVIEPCGSTGQPRS
ncbi:MAG: hypothetical protein ACD_34C00474G0001, partial [uncultured bacterium]